MRRTTPNSRPRRFGFTLTEILIVIALIVLIIALAVPAFSLITGSRSVDAGENLVSAMLSRARAEAIRNNRVAGIAFFRDPASERSAMAIVVPAPERGSLAPEPTGLEQYKGWKEFQEGSNARVRYEQGDVVVALLPDPDVPGNKKTTQLFVCREPHNATRGTNEPPRTPYWGTLNEEEMDTLVGYEYQLLPPGVGVQTINDPDPESGTAAGAPAMGRDRYLRNGLILFDGNGAVLHRKYSIGVPAMTDVDQTHLYRLMSFDKRPFGMNTIAVGMDPGNPIYSQLGVVLYDEQNFLGAGGTQDDPLNDNAAYNSAPPRYNEMVEEPWLDRNGLSLMLNRYNGTLVRGE